MAREIFRQVALDRMVSPERTDHSLRLIGAPTWIVLVSLIAAVTASIAWGLQTTAPVKIKAQGILIDQSGLVEIASEQGGALDNVKIRPGDIVAPGDVVATLSRNALRRELIGAEAKLADLRERYGELEGAFAARTRREERADQNKLAALERTRGVLQDRLVLLRERADKIAPLAARKVVPELRFIEAQIAVSDMDEKIATLIETEQKIGLDAAERTSQREFDLLEDRLEITAQEREIARLTEQLSDEQVIRSSHHGQVVEIKVNSGDVLAPGTALATLASVDIGRNLQALMFVPPAEGKRVEPGMLAEISPTTVEREVYGHILAEVISVAPLPATPEGMRRVLQNDQLVEQLSVGGAPIEVRLSLSRTDGTATGFAWSSSSGPVGGVNAGTLLDGRIVVDERALVDLVLPGATSTLSPSQTSDRN